MSYTKKEFIIAAMTELGLGDSVFDMQDEDLTSSLNLLDAMVAEWRDSGIAINYPLQSDPGSSSLATATGVPDKNNMAVIKNLAVKIAPSFGAAAVLSRETKVDAKNAYIAMLRTAQNTNPMKKQFPEEMPLGSGHKTWRNNNRDPFFPIPDDPIQTSNSQDLDLTT